MKHLKLRRQIIATAQRMNGLGINQGTSGNVSARVASGLLITPSGVSYESLRPADLIEMDFDGSWECSVAERRPSSEWRFHLDVLRARPEFGALVHVHSIYATALACQRRGIPSFHYMVAVAGGNSIRCAPYATFGTVKLSRNALQALEGRSACLLANHGMIACGSDLEPALALAVEVETLAAQYTQALQTGRPKILSEDEMKRVLIKFKAGYGYGSAPREIPKAAGTRAARPLKRRLTGSARQSRRR